MRLAPQLVCTSSLNGTFQAVAAASAAILASSYVPRTRAKPTRGQTHHLPPREILEMKLYLIAAAPPFRFFVREAASAPRGAIDWGLGAGIVELVSARRWRWLCLCCCVASSAVGLQCWCVAADAMLWLPARAPNCSCGVCWPSPWHRGTLRVCCPLAP